VNSELNRRVLVKGGGGFVGSHLCDRLIASGCKVLVADNFSTGQERNIDHLLADPEFELFPWDVTRPLPFEVDQLYNLACAASPARFLAAPLETTKTSVLGAINALELASGCGARILQASTSEVYGDPAQHPQHEDYWGHVNPIGPRACYDEGKRCAETLFFDYHRQLGVEIKVVRIFNTYGPRMRIDDGRVVSNFIVQALTGRDITVYGDGTQSRSFCYVDDTVDGLLRMMASPDGCLGPVNLGNPTECTILELAGLVLELTGSTSRVVFRKLGPDDPRRRKPDIGRAKDLLGWQPEVALRQGLSRTIEYFEQQLTSEGLAAFERKSA
jgi:UDP-glucuronate decarboxylase